MRAGMNILKLLLPVFLVIVLPPELRGSWEEWELGGELGLAVGAGTEGGRLLSPGVMVTATKDLEDRRMELGVGFMYGFSEEENYSGLVHYDYQDSPGIIADEGKDIRTRLMLVPLTVNFLFDFREDFYVGGGVGLYNVFITDEPLGPWRVDPDSNPGETVRRPSTTAFGAQQMVGVEIFPMSPNWNWFVGMKSFVVFRTRLGTIFGSTIGGKVRYTW